MKGHIELKFLETFGQADRIIFFIHLPSPLVSKKRIDLSLVNDLPELSSESNRKILPAVHHVFLFKALKQLMQDNPGMFYIESRLFHDLLENLETKGHINTHQVEMYKRQIETRDHAEGRGLIQSPNSAFDRYGVFGQANVRQSEALPATPVRGRSFPCAIM